MIYFSIKSHTALHDFISGKEFLVKFSVIIPFDE